MLVNGFEIKKQDKATGIFNLLVESLLATETLLTDRTDSQTAP